MYQDLQIIHKNGQPHGIRDRGGYLIFFPKVTKWPNQEDRYKKELQESFDLAETIIKTLSKNDQN